MFIPTIITLLLSTLTLAQSPLSPSTNSTNTLPYCYRTGLPLSSPLQKLNCYTLIEKYIYPSNPPHDILSWSYYPGSQRALPATWVRPDNQRCIIGIKNKDPGRRRSVPLSGEDIFRAVDEILTGCGPDGKGGQKSVGIPEQDFFVEVYAPYANEGGGGSAGSGDGVIAQ